MSGHVTATDLFAGAGGGTEGMTQAGIEVEIAANHWPVAIATHRLNHPTVETRTKDLSEVDWRTFPSTDVLWASPSCVWHARSGGRKTPSVQTERAREDRGAIDRATAFAVIEAAEVHAYPVIFVENVTEFRAWTLYQWWLDGLRALGYRVAELLLDAADFGLAQRRPRTFVVATLPGAELDLTVPALPRVPASAILDEGLGPVVVGRRYVTPQIEEIDAELEGVPHLVMMRRNAHARRADSHQLATITAGGNHHGIATLVNGRAHYRLLSNRECARGQGFRDDFEFAGTTAEVKRQIGNAVPVAVARWLGERAVAALGTTTEDREVA